MNHLVKLAVVSACLGTCALAGDVTGKVTFEGAAPKMARINMGADPVCMKAHKTPVFSEEVVVNKNGTLKNVIIFVKDGLSGKKFSAPSTAALFDQKGCEYVPHVLAFQTGQELEVVNSDPTLHNVHSLSKDNAPFNTAQPGKGINTLHKKFDKPEIFKVKCEVHTWMNAYMGVFNHPFFAVTGDDGTFDLKKLPAGDYTIEAWHEKYPPQTMKVKVPASGEAKVDFKYSAK